MSALAYLARRFVAGERMTDAVRAIESLNTNGIAATLDVLGEEVTSRALSEAALQEYLKVLEEISKAGVQSNISVKLSAMGLGISEEFCLSQMKGLVSAAQAQNNFVRIDMEGSNYTERTLGVFKKLYRDHSNVGVVLQAQLFRTEKDAAELASLKAPVRVCKGAYHEASEIAFRNMNDIRANFRLIVMTLIQNDCRVAIATHDEQLIRWAIEWTEKIGVPRNQYEFQMLYGLRRKRARELAKAGYNVRTYVPYGTHWFPYFYRRLRERKENVLFVLRNLFAD
jgi:proline dehydrogenase